MSTVKKVYTEAEEKARELESIDFNSIDNLDLTSYFEAIKTISEKDTDSNFKTDEAENVITKCAAFISEETHKELGSKRQAIYDLIRKYDPNSEIVKSFVETDINKVYGIAKYLLKSYVDYIKRVPYLVKMSRDEFKFINRIISNAEYGVDDVFNYIELVDNFLGDARKQLDISKNNEILDFKIDISNILIIQHLTREYKVKGNTVDFKYFSAISFKLNEYIKLYNAFTVIAQRINDDFILWGTALDSVVIPKNVEIEPENEVI